MSYCRFTDGDVYAYDTDGGVQFWVSGDNRELDRLCNTFYEAYRYAKELSDVHGLDVPSYAVEALREDALEEANRISGVVVELQAENAKLRKLVKAFDWCTENFDLPCKCDSCPLEQTDKLTPECEVRMRELRIEVDE